MPAISVTGLVKRFGQIEALRGVDFAVEQGTVFGLLGPNGSGKTTTIRILSTILHADAGSASVLGHDVAREARTVRTVIGLAGQYAAVDGNLTGAENLRLMGRLAHLPSGDVRSRAAELLAQFGLTDAGSRPVRTYSGGMRRRLDLAAALVHRPPVLFLDEPTTGLDPQGRNDLWDTIRTLVVDGTTVLLTTQYLEEADRLAQRVAVMDHGRVIANDTPSSLKSSLGSTVIEIGLKTKTAAARARKALPAALLARAEVNGTMLRLTSDSARTITQVLAALEKARIEPISVEVRPPSLDDVFLTLTGRTAGAEQVSA